MKVACCRHIVGTTQSKSNNFWWAREPMNQLGCEVSGIVAVNFWDGRDSHAVRKLFSALLCMVVDIWASSALPILFSAISEKTSFGKRKEWHTSILFMGVLANAACIRESWYSLMSPCYMNFFGVGDDSFYKFGNIGDNIGDLLRMENTRPGRI